MSNVLVLNWLSKARSVVFEGIKKFDLFSQKIMFTYKGNSSFSTVFGGFVSLIIFTIIGVYWAILMQVMVSRTNSNNSLSTEVVDLTTHDQDYYPVDYGFAFGVAFTDTSGIPIPLDPSYFTLDISQAYIVKVGNYYSFEKTSLGYKLWNSTDINITNQAYLARGLSSFLYWPVNKRYKIAGNYLSNNYQFISISLKKWTGVGCKPSALIDQVLQGVVVSVPTLNSYMDFNDYVTPIKSYLEDRSSFNILPSNRKIIKLYAKLNSANLNDDYLKLQSATSKGVF